MHIKLTIKTAMFVASYAIAMPCYSATSYISPEQLNKQVSEQSESVVVVDVRGFNQYAAEHISGAINVPMAAIAGHNFATEKSIALYCSGIGCPLSERASDILMGKGYSKVVVLSGGIEAWKSNGFPVVSENTVVASAASGNPYTIHKISASDLVVALSKGEVVVVDVRSANEYSAGHIKGALNIPFTEIVGRTKGLSKDKTIVVYARAQGAASTSAKEFAKIGFKVFELTGGVQIWAAQGLALMAGGESLAQ